jgi:hypothetical protein
MDQFFCYFEPPWMTVEYLLCVEYGGGGLMFFVVGCGNVGDRQAVTKRTRALSYPNYRSLITNYNSRQFMIENHSFVFNHNPKNKQETNAGIIPKSATATQKTKFSQTPKDETKNKQKGYPKLMRNSYNS